MTRGPREFRPIDHLAANCLALSLEDPCPEDTVCIPLLLADQPIAGAGGRTFRLGRHGFVSFAPPQPSHLAEVAAHVFPADAVAEASGAGFVVYVQLAQVETDISASGADLDPHPLVAKVLPRRLLGQLAAGEGEAAVGVVLAYDGETSFVVSPAADPRRAVSALDEVGWIAPDIAPSILQRLVDPAAALVDPAVMVSTGDLYVRGWVSKVLQTATKHGASEPRTRRVVVRPPSTQTVERMTPEKLVAAAKDGRLASPFDADTLRWAGTELGLLLVTGGLPSLEVLLDELRALDPELADEVAATCAERFGLLP